MNWIHKLLVAIIVLIANVGLAQEMNIKIIQGSIILNREVVSKPLEMIKVAENSPILSNFIIKKTSQLYNILS